MIDPYAPPRAESEPRERKRRRSDFAGERRSVFVLFILCVVTVGIYPAIWFVRRQNFIDSLGPLAAHQKLSPLPWVNVGLLVLLFLLGAAEGAGVAPQLPNPGAVAGILGVMIAFRVRTILRSYFAQTGRFITISGVATFFFGVLYLQHIFNKAADDPGRVRKKKRKRSSSTSKTVMT